MKLLFILTKNLMLWQILNFELLPEQLYNLGVNNNSLDDRLLTREAFWCAQLCTLTPHGLNKSASLIPGIGFATINTMLLLHFM